MLSEIIQNRRAVFPAQYNQELITKGEIETILGSANWAPTHRRTEPWRFKIFHGETKEMLGAFLAQKYLETADNFSEFKHKKISEKCKRSGAIIAICMQRDPANSIPEWEEIAATAMAVQNMWLTATSLNIGAYWSSSSMRLYMNEHIVMNEGERCLGFFYMGKYDGKLPEGERKTSIAEKTAWI